MATRSPSTGRAPMTEDQARKRVDEEKAFYGNLAAYLVVIPFLAALNLFTDPGSLWFVFPMMGWGLGLASHAVATFGMPGLGRGWEARRVDALLGSEPSEARLRALLDETLDERAVPAGQPQDLTRLQRRIEHLEAIVTSHDWDDAAALPAVDPPARTPLADHLLEDEDASDQGGDSPADRAARLARRVR